MQKKYPHTYNGLVRIGLIAGVLAANGCSLISQGPTQGERVIIHTVEAGETLESIAEDYYGDHRRAKKLRRFNNVDDEDIAVGAQLRIPMKPDEIQELKQRERARLPYNRGLELVARGSYLDATAEFRNALELDPDFAEARYNLGLTYQRMKAHDKALDEFNKAAQLEPKNADYHYAIGSVRFHEERYGSAIKSFEKALKYDPAHLKSQYSLAAALEKEGRIKHARIAWARYLQLDSTSEWAARARSRLETLPQ